MAGVTITPAATPVAPAVKPAASLADAYDIGQEDIIDQEPATSVAPVASVLGESESPPARPVPPKDPVTGQFVKKTHPKWLERQARHLGISDEEIGEMETDSLGEAVTATMRFADEDRRARATDPQRPPEPTSTTEPAIDWGKDVDGTPYTERDYQGPVADTAKRALALEKRVKELEGMVQSLLQNEGRRAQEQHYDRVDQVFADQPKFSSVIGTGPRHKLPKGGPALKRRAAVLAEAWRLAGQNATEEQRLEKVPKVLEEMFGDLVAAQPEPTPAPVQAAEVERWNNGATARPTHRAGAPEPKGRQAAVKAVQNILRERSQNGEEVQDEDFPS